MDEAGPLSNPVAPAAAAPAAGPPKMLHFEPAPETPLAAAALPFRPSLPENKQSTLDNPYVVEIVGGKGLPSMDFLDESDPYARVRLIHDDQKHKFSHKFNSIGEERQTMLKNDTVNPVWRSYVDFGLSQATVVEKQATHLVIDVWDEDLGGDEWMCRAKINLSDLTGEEQHFSYTTKHNMKHVSEVVDSHTGDKANGSGCCNSGGSNGYITVRTAHPQGPVVDKMTCFFIRHGESQWNKVCSTAFVANHCLCLACCPLPSRLRQCLCLACKAQEASNFYEMMKRVNHPLSADGIKQCQNFNAISQGEQPKAAPRYEDFMSADMIFASPLTRATQTALLTLKGHPTLQQHGMVLASTAREVKNTGGQDTVGDKCGTEVLETVEAECRDFDRSGMAAEEVAAVLQPIKPLDEPGVEASRSDVGLSMGLSDCFSWVKGGGPKVDIFDAVSPW